MRYTCKVKIKSDIESVFNISLSKEDMLDYSPNLISYEILEKDGNSEGSKTKLLFKSPNGTFSMKETIEKISFPTSHTVIYEVDGVWNKCISQFINKDNTVIYELDTEFKFLYDNIKEDEITLQRFKEST